MVLTTAQLTAFKIQIICHPLPIDVLPQWRLLPPLMEGSEWPEVFSQLVPQNHEFLLTRTNHFGWFGGAQSLTNPPSGSAQETKSNGRSSNSSQTTAVFGAFEISAQPKMQTLPNSVNVYCAFLFWIWPSHGVFSPIPSSYPRPQF